MRFKLVAKEWDETGEIGWIRKDANQDLYNPLGVDYYGLAHDLLEHRSLQHVGDEMEAHGALFYLRGPDTGWCSKYGNIVNAKNIGEGDWIPLFQAVAFGDGYFPSIAKQSRIQDYGVEDAIEEIIRIGKNSVREEFDQEDTPSTDIEKTLNTIASVYADYFRKGYRLAKRRYRDCPDRAHLFNTTFEALKRQTPEFEGQELAITIDIKSCRVRVDDVTEEMYY